MTAALDRKVRLIVLLGGLATFAPITFDMYLPAFPQLEHEFGASASQVQLTLTTCLIALGLGQVVAGPLSDSFGRRRPLVIGLSIYVVASVACSLASSIAMLTVLRFVQGLAAGAGVVMSRTVVRDLYTGAEAVRFFSLILLVNGLAPILAPNIGAGVLTFTSWRGVFVTLAVIGALLLLSSALWLRETLPVERRRPVGLSHTLRALREPLRDRVFLGYAAAQGLAMGTAFAYIAGSSFVLQDHYGVSRALFAVSFGVNGVGIVIGSQSAGFLVHRREPRTLLMAGLTGLTVATCGLVVAVGLDLGLVGFLPALFLTLIFVGFCNPNATVLALAGHERQAGSASALLGLAQFTVGALVAPLVGVAGSSSAWPLVLVMATLAACALIAVTTLTRDAPEVPPGVAIPIEAGSLS